MRRAARTNGGIDSISVPASDLFVHDPSLAPLADPSIDPDPSRVGRLTEEHPASDAAVSMATITRASTGGSLRTMFKASASERGVFACPVTGRLHHWEGAAARSMLVWCTTAPGVVSFGTETVHVSHPEHGGYTIDLEVVLGDGSRRFIEVKRSEADLAEPAYRAKLAWAAEVFRRCGTPLALIFRNDIFRSPTHRRNAELFASRGFVHVDGDVLDMLDEMARSGAVATYGGLATRLGRGDPLRGRNLVQALVVRRRLGIDLTRRLGDQTPVTIH